MKNNENPFDLFEKHFEEVKNNKDINQPNAMNLATVGADHKPSSRMVLLKEFDENGFVYYTNLSSRKAKETKKTPYVALCFHWEPLGIQVRIEGKVKLVSNERADAYFHSRPRGSRIGAWASQQSKQLDCEQTLLDRIKFYEEKFPTDNIPRPEFWSGFLVEPKRVEFWYDGNFRIHTRKQFTLVDGEWEFGFLYP